MVRRFSKYLILNVCLECPLAYSFKKPYVENFYRVSDLGFTLQGKVCHFHCVCWVKINMSHNLCTPMVERLTKSLASLSALLESLCPLCHCSTVLSAACVMMPRQGGKVAKPCAPICSQSGCLVHHHAL